jgi:hypothetical protein
MSWKSAAVDLFADWRAAFSIATTSPRVLGTDLSFEIREGPTPCLVPGPRGFVALLHR